jgi:hypothetical protein
MPALTAQTCASQCGCDSAVKLFTRLTTCAQVTATWRVSMAMQPNARCPASAPCYGGPTVYTSSTAFDRAVVLRAPARCANAQPRQGSQRLPRTRRGQSCQRQTPRRQPGARCRTLPLQARQGCCTPSGAARLTGSAASAGGAGAGPGRAADPPGLRPFTGPAGGAGGDGAPPRRAARTAAWRARRARSRRCSAPRTPGGPRARARRCARRRPRRSR